MPASDQNDEFRASLPSWNLVDDCVKGSAAIKSEGTKYLPKPNADDNSAENTTRYKDYKERASFVNFTGHTKSGLIGLVFRKDMEVDFPATVEYLVENANGAGLTLDQLARDVVGEVLEAGRYGLLVDYPAAEEGLTAAEVTALNLRANILPYKAKSIINWRTENIGGVSVLSLVVLSEDHGVIFEDGFGSEIKEYHRVLRLIDGVYTQELYDEGDQLLFDSVPRKRDGSVWNEIPFIFVGAENNDTGVDKAPLLDIAEINVSHYRNSADYEESSFMVGQPTPFVSGLTQSWVDSVMKGGVILGSRSAILLPDGGAAGLLQADPNQMPERGMEMKEAQMVKIGARIIIDNKGTETAEAARIRFGGQSSQLGTVVGNAESGIIQCTEWVMEFMGEGEVELVLNREFYDATIDPQTIMAQIQLVDRGIIADTDLRTNLRKGGMIANDRTDEEIEGEAEDITGFEG
jgi:hypothetical protein